jgi:hypothetical protein
MFENRRHMRIREIADIRWTILGTDTVGEGKVLNISTSGMLLTTDEKFNARMQGMMYIDAPDSEPLAFGPKKGKLVWMRRMPDGRKGFQCGLEFQKNVGPDKALEEWLNKKTEELSRAESASILNHYVF